MEKNYVEIIKELFGNEMFSKLSDELYLKVNSKYPRINIKEATKMVESNLAVILIVGIEKARGCPEAKLKERVYWHNVCPKSLLIEKSISKFIKDYEEYISVVKEKVANQEGNAL